MRAQQFASRFFVRVEVQPYHFGPRPFAFPLTVRRIARCRRGRKGRAPRVKRGQDGVPTVLHSAVSANTAAAPYRFGLITRRLYLGAKKYDIYTAMLYVLNLKYPFRTSSFRNEVVGSHLHFTEGGFFSIVKAYQNPMYSVGFSNLA